jgi:DNA-binding NtrC family response regulator
MNAGANYRKDFLAWQRRYLLRALISAGGCRLQAAAMIGVHRNTMGRKMCESAITRNDVREALASGKSK